MCGKMTNTMTRTLVSLGVSVYVAILFYEMHTIYLQKPSPSRYLKPTIVQTLHKSKQMLPYSFPGACDKNWKAPGFVNVLFWRLNKTRIPLKRLNKWLKDLFTGRCEVWKCAISTNSRRIREADVVLFWSQQLIHDGFPLPTFRDPKQIWLFMTLETLFENYGKKGVLTSAVANPEPRVDTVAMRNLFNLTMSFRLDADIVARHGIYVPKEAFDPVKHKHWNIKSLPPVKLAKKRSTKGHSIAWFVSHCQTNDERERYAQLLKQHIEIDIYGKCGTKSCGSQRYFASGVSLWKDPCFKMANKKYMFILAFENAQCKHYVTEKVYNGLLYDAIPIVMSGHINQSDFVPPHSIINIGHFRTPKHLAEYLHYLTKNKTAYLEYFKWRQNYYVGSLFSGYDFCPFCAQLHDLVASGEKTFVTDIHHWYQQKSEKHMTNLDWYKQWRSVPTEKDPIIEEWKSRNLKA